MFDTDVVLEAMRVLCSDGLTSAQTQEFNVGSAAADVSLGAVLQQLSITDFTHLALCGTAPWTSNLAGAVGGPRCFIDLPNDIVRDPKTGKITLKPKDLVWAAEHLDPRFNYDFSKLKDTEKYSRGGEEYKRPCGWQRFGLKVLDEYEDNTWLGTMNRETESESGEWPVSYHGTLEKHVKAITEEGYTTGPRHKHGYGIYSTPDIEIAKKDYAKEFCCNGRKYKVIMQNRINKEYRVICVNEPKFWLVPIEDKTKEREIVKKAIRPYGILLIEV